MIDMGVLVKRTILLPSLAAAFFCVAPGAKAATTIVFDAGASECVANGTRCMMLQSFGDTDAVDASYHNIRSDGSVIGDAHQVYTNFGDLGKVLTAGRYLDGTLGQVSLMARPGYKISLLDFDFVGYVGFSPTLPLKVLDLLGNEIVAGTFGTGNGSNHSNLLVNSAYLDGVIIRWGPDASVGGIDNIRYDVQAPIPDVQAPVPEPASWAMMMSGFALLGVSMRSRRKALKVAAG